MVAITLTGSGMANALTNSTSPLSIHLVQIEVEAGR